MLPRFQLLRTSNPDQFRDTAVDTFGVAKAVVPSPDGFEIWSKVAQVNEIALVTGGSNNGFSLEYAESDFARLQFAKKGRGASTVAGVTGVVESGLASVASPGRAARMDYGEDHERLTVRLPTRSIWQKLTTLTGVQPKGLLDFRASVDLNTPNARVLRDLVWFLEAQLDSVLLSPLVIREIEQAIITSFLLATEHGFSDLLRQDARGCAPHQVRLIEDFIEANWDRPIRIEDLAAMTDVAARTLFRSFEKARGYSPMAFVKTVRLKHARKMLASGDPGTSVTGVAFRCGFANLGHFARDYKNAFGELPSQTLARAR